jgi:adenine-specific DNA-methyltransferase
MESNPRLFTLVRKIDQSGISGTGRVLDGVVFHTGQVVNLEVLRILQKSYASRVKMIYIDPPYNTGQDFIYKDDFKEPVESYLEKTSQSDEQGLLTSNPKASGRFHSNWLNMMYPRLRLARNLLKDDGVIFISIDDNEISNLHKLCDEIFGEEHFIACFIWKSRQNKDNRTTNGASVDHEYILCYGKQIRGAERNIDQYTNSDNDPRGPWTSANMVGLATIDRRPNLHYDLIAPDSNINYGCPKMGWRYDKKTMSKLILEGRILWPNSSDGRPRRKSFLNDLTSDFTGYSSMIGSDLYTRNGTADVEEIFGFRAMDFPKPVNLIKELINQGMKSNDIILDFFSGSCTTAHAVFKQNQEDGGKRKFIMVQIPEVCDQKSESFIRGFKTISEIGKERIRKVSNTLKKEGINIDLGFKVFKLEKTNISKWQDFHDQNMNELEGLFSRRNESLIEGWKEESVLTEIQLIEGFPLDSTKSNLPEFINNSVWELKHSDISFKLIICLDDKIETETVTIMASFHDAVLVCLDKALSDQSKLTLSDKLKVKTI